MPILELTLAMVSMFYKASNSYSTSVSSSSLMDRVYLRCRDTSFASSNPHFGLGTRWNDSWTNPPPAKIRLSCQFRHLVERPSYHYDHGCRSSQPSKLRRSIPIFRYLEGSHQTHRMDSLRLDFRFTIKFCDANCLRIRRCNVIL